MDSLASILPRILARRGLKSQAQASLVVYRAQAWLREHLPDVQEMLRAEKILHGNLVIRCTHSIAAQECQHILPLLQDHLCRECGEGAITGIRLVRA